MKKAKLIAIIILTILFFTIAIPIIINESYKHGIVYVTKWDAAAVLSYYGTILSAIATAAAMAGTIVFTFRQIRRDSYLKSETEKWSKIESVFSEALDTINPMRSFMETIDAGFVDPGPALKTMQKYQLCCRTAIDQLNAYLNTADYPKVKKLIDAINDFSEEAFQITQKRIEAYSKLRDYHSRDTSQRTIDTEAMYPNSFPEETLSFCRKILEDTKDIRLEDIQAAIAEPDGQLVSVYQDTYRPLLQLKGLTFEIINIEIQKKADSILHLWGE